MYYLIFMIFFIINGLLPMAFAQSMAAFQIQGQVNNSLNQSLSSCDSWGFSDNMSSWSPTDQPNVISHTTLPWKANGVSIKDRPFTSFSGVFAYFINTPGQPCENWPGCKGRFEIDRAGNLEAYWSPLLNGAGSNGSGQKFQCIIDTKTNAVIQDGKVISPAVFNVSIRP